MLLDDFIAFHRDDIDLITIAAGFVLYSACELWKLFEHYKPDLASEALKRIHAAKKTGANIVGNEPENSEHDDIDRP